MKVSAIIEARYHDTRPPLEQLRSAIVDAITTRKPSDITTRKHDGDWFRVNDRGHVVWNWPVREIPAMYIAKQMGGDILKAWEAVRYQEKANFMNRILNSKAVKAVKQRVVQKSKKPGQSRDDVIQSIERIDQKIGRLVLAKQKLKDML